MKKALSLLLSATMVLGLAQQANVGVHAQTQHKGIEKFDGYQVNYNPTPIKDTHNTITGLNIDPEKRVNVIVKFNSQSLAEKFEKSNMDNYLDYATSHASTVKKVENKVEELTQNVVEVTDQKGTKNDAIVNDTYSILFTGCSVEVPYKEVGNIEQMDGVEEVFLSHTYDVPDTGFKVETKPNMLTSHDMIGSEGAWENGTGYDGEGMAIAVIDTGIDIGHEAFKTMPTNPRYTAKDIQSILDKNDMSAEKVVSGLSIRLNANENGGSSSVYKNAKIPFAFDYVDRDTDVVPVHEQYHGTHVSGTVAGNCEKIKGVAPNAQLIGMKVFPDAGGAMDEDILHALEDCVILNVDAINMSLGSSSGFAKYGQSALQAGYDAVKNVGINLNVSAGNSYNSAFGNNHNHLQPVTMPDEGIVGSPSTLDASLSVAAINNTHMGPAPVIRLADGTAVGYSDGCSVDYYKFTTLPKGDYEIVDCGRGTGEDFAKVNAKGKIAIVERGDISFQDKHDNAKNAGAKALIVYNNQSGSLTMSIEGYSIPAVFVSRTYGLKMLELGKAISLDPSKTDNVESPDAWTMCDFSSIGTTPTMAIKPEITAPGGNIYSAVYVENGKSEYKTISGTSMASPHMAGASALIKEYVKKTYPNLNAIETQQLVNNLAMSTADPVKQTNGVFYSPRKQGSGIVKVDEAIKTPAYLTVKGSERPKAELGYNQDGHYSYTMTVHNMSEKDVSYRVNTVALAETYQNVDGEYFTTEVDEDITSFATISYQGVSNGAVEVKAGATKDITVDIQLDMNSSKVKELQSVYTNGFFVEGFTTLENDMDASLAVPYVGFCGDWAKAPVFDKKLYDLKGDEQAEFFNGSQLGLHISGSSIETTGQNKFKAMFGFGVEYGDYCIALGASDRLVPLTTLLRGAEKLNYSIVDPNGKEVFKQSENYIGKSYATGNDEVPLAFAEYWMKVTPLYQPGRGAAQGIYTLTETATVGGTNGSETQELVYHFTIDSTLPKWDADRTALYEEDGKYYVRLSVEDNTGLAGVACFKTDDYDDDYPFAAIAFDHVDTNGQADKREVVACLGTKDALRNKVKYNSVKFAVYDYAGNYQKKTFYVTDKPSDIENPEQPETLKAASLKKVENTGVNEMTVTFDKVEGATGYKVYRAVDGSEFDMIADTTKTVFVDGNASKVGSTYSYKIVAYNEKMEAEASNVLSAVSEKTDETVEPKELEATTLVSVSNTAYGTMKLEYTDVAGAIGYKILRKVGDGEFESLGTTQENTFVDKTATTVGETYTYKVVAFDNEKEAKASNEVSAVSAKEKPATGLAAPTIVSAVNNAKGQITLKWDAVEGAKGYFIYRAVDDGAFVEYDSTSATKFVDKRAKSYGSTYSYKVIAYDFKSMSEESAVIECVSEIGAIKAPVISSIRNNGVGRIVLEFTESEGAMRYVIFRAEDDAERLTEWAKADGSPWEDHWDIRPGHTYSYRIQAEGYENGVYSKASNEVSIVADFGEVIVEPTLDAAVLTGVENTAIGQMTVNWNKVEGATGYKVFRSVNENGFEQIADVAETSFVDNSATTIGATYAYKVVAYDTETEADFSNVISCVSEKDYPLEATEITSVKNTDKGQMTVQFNAVAKATGYHVYVSVDNGEFQLAGDTTDTVFVDKNAKKYGANYSYKVVAFNEKENAPESNVVSAKSEIGLLKAAVVTKVENTDVNTMTINFAAVEGATGYKVFRAVDAEGFKLLTTVSTTSYVDKTATKLNSTYAYKVVAFNEEIEAPESNTMSAVSLKKKEEEVKVGQVKGFKVTCSLVKFYNLTWDKVDGADGYEIYRKEGNGNYIKIQTNSKNVRICVDVPSLRKGKTFTYKVRAFKNTKQGKVYGKFSKEITIKTKGLLF